MRGNLAKNPKQCSDLHRQVTLSTAKPDHSASISVSLVTGMLPAR
jgi:hypothetical protein